MGEWIEVVRSEEVRYGEGLNRKEAGTGWEEDVTHKLRYEALFRPKKLSKSKGN